MQVDNERVLAEALEAYRADRPEEELPKLEEVARHLLATTGLRFDDGVRHPILKWEQPSGHAQLVRADEAGPKELEAVISAMKAAALEIRDLTGFTYELPGDLAEGEPADLYVLYGDHDVLLENAAILEEAFGLRGFTGSLRAAMRSGEPACTMAVRFTEDHALDLAAITVDASGPIERCVYGGFLQSMGLIAEHAVASGSVLGADGRHDEFTERDRFALEALYSGAFVAGQVPSIDEVLRAVRRVLPEEV